MENVNTLQVSPEALGLGAALAVGLLIGLERGWRDRDLPDGARIAGLRTFALTGLLGGVLGSLLPQFGPWPLLGGAHAGAGGLCSAGLGSVGAGCGGDCDGVAGLEAGLARRAALD